MYDSQIEAPCMDFGKIKFGIDSAFVQKCLMCADRFLETLKMELQRMILCIGAQCVAIRNVDL